MILWQVWCFVAPGLYSNEKRYAVPFIVGGVLLFFLGAGLAYWSIPRALEFLGLLARRDRRCELLRRKELATYQARNRRLVAAMVELKFDELLEEGPESCGPCSCLPFCA